MLVLLLVVILALILWQVARTYFDYKSGGVDLSATLNLLKEQGSKVVSSGRKLLQAQTPEERKKYFEKIGQRASTVAETGLSTLDASKKEVASKGWFSGLTGMFTGKPKTEQPAPQPAPQTQQTPQPQQTQPAPSAPPLEAQPA